MNERNQTPSRAHEFCAGKSRENLPLLTSNLLYEANASNAAEKNRLEFYERWMSGEIIMVKRCSDSRVSVSTRTAIDNASMGTEGPKEPYTKLMSNTNGVANIYHFDGILSKKGEEPVGCGAFAGKKCQEKDGLRDGLADEDSEWYVFEMKSSNQIRNGISNSEAIARHTGKSVLFGFVDHRRLELIPTAVVWKKGTSLTLIVPETLPISYLLQEEKYDSARIYKDGIPRLDEGQIPEQFMEFLEDTKRDYEELKNTHPDLLKTQAKQNPHTLFLTTEKITPRGRYPGVFDKPGSVFVVHVSGVKGNEPGFKISDRSIRTAFQQSHYAVEHLGVRNIVFETADITQSLKMAEEFCKRQLFKRWCAIDENQIFSIESAKARTKQIIEMKITG